MLSAAEFGQNQLLFPEGVPKAMRASVTKKEPFSQPRFLYKKTFGSHPHCFYSGNDAAQRKRIFLGSCKKRLSSLKQFPLDKFTRQRNALGFSAMTAYIITARQRIVELQGKRSLYS